MKNPVSMKKIVSAFFLMAGMIFGSVAYAEQPNLILFCSGWNMKCREARKTCSSVAQELGMKFTELDIDQASSQQAANKMRVNLPSSIPYIYVMNDKGKLVKEWIFSGESPQVLKQKLLGR